MLLLLEICLETKTHVVFTHLASKYNFQYWKIGFIKKVSKIHVTDIENSEFFQSNTDPYVQWLLSIFKDEYGNGIYKSYRESRNNSYSNEAIVSLIA